MASSECYFQCGKDAPLNTGGKARIESVISSSIARNDTHHVELKQQLQNNPDFKITFHKDCISTYTSSTHIKRYLKRMGSSISPSEAPLPKLRSKYPAFNFRSQCLICSQDCLPKDPKNPGRWRRVVICRTVDMKQTFFKVCDERGDNVADGVRVRINAAITDLHAADAQYHLDCYTTFVSKRNIAAASSTSEKQEPDPTDLAFKYVVDTLQDNPAKMWNSVEIYEVYRNFLNSAECPSTSTSAGVNNHQHNSGVTQVIDITATALKLGDKCFDLLAVHALSGCDTVSYPFGKGKVSALNLMLKLDLNLHVFTEPDAEEVDWMKAGIDFLSYLYCGKIMESLNNLRYTLFSRKKDPPKIQTLPPTDKSAIEHIKRARLQVLIWRAADQIEPPADNIFLFGWRIEDDVPVPVHGIVVAPKELLKLVACGCKSVAPCSRANCSCQSAGVSCTSYCKCEAKEHCANVHTKKTEHVVETDEEEELDDRLADEKSEDEG